MISDQIDGNRIFDRIMRLSKIGRIGEKGVQRVALSVEDQKAHDLVTKWMEDAGMKVRHDNFGNLIGRKEGNRPDMPVIMIGSHIDTVPNGGRFDGTIGVLGGIEVVHAMNEVNISHDPSIEVVAFCEEEGSRFVDGTFGSRGMAGKIDKKDLERRDKQQITRYEALKNFGFGVNPDAIDASRRNPGDIKVYLEMHIEQGPYLEANNYPIGIVKGIAGPSWFNIKVMGEAGHAGTVPMKLRKDPMVGAAEVIKEIELICKKDSTETCVATIGKITASPGGGNVIPDSVEFSLDIRDIDLKRKNTMIEQIEEMIDRICKRRGLRCLFEKQLGINPVNCSEHVTNALQGASDHMHIQAPTMVSGAGHDAMFMAEITEVGMIFVRCRKGISHNPEEWSDKGDIEKGTRLLFETVRKYI